LVVKPHVAIARLSPASRGDKTARVGGQCFPRKSFIVLYDDIKTLLTLPCCEKVSLEQLPHFIDILPCEVIECITHIGILNNAHLMEHLEKFSAIKKLYVLKDITLVKMGGVKIKNGLELVVRAIDEFAGKEYNIIGV